jgi:hypothetical protein
MVKMLLAVQAAQEVWAAVAVVVAQVVQGFFTSSIKRKNNERKHKY